MSNITSVAKQFFEACETGKGWEGCRAYCTSNASFSAQAEPLAEVRTLQGYADWMKGLLSFMPDGCYAVKSFATDDDRNSVCAYGVFSATHTGHGGPCPPTGKSTTTDYVYVMDFEGDKIDLERRLGDEGARLGLTRAYRGLSDPCRAADRRRTTVRTLRLLRRPGPRRRFASTATGRP